MDSAALNDLRAVLARINKQVSNQLAAVDVLEYAAGQAAVLGFAATVTRCDGNLVLSVVIEPGQMLADLAAWKEMEAALPPAPAPIEDAPAPVVEDPAPIEDAPAPVVEDPAPVEGPEPVEDAAGPVIENDGLTEPLAQSVKEVIADLRGLMRAANIDRVQFIALLVSLARGNPDYIIAAELRRPVALICELLKCVPASEKERRQLRHVLEAQEAGAAP